MILLFADFLSFFSFVITFIAIYSTIVDDPKDKYLMIEVIRAFFSDFSSIDKVSLIKFSIHQSTSTNHHD